MAELLEFVNLTRRFDRDNYQLRVSGSLAEGSVLAVQGPSGAGKSTLLKMLARLLAHHEGGMVFHGQDYREISPLEWRRKIQYLAQKPVVFGGTVEDNLKLPFSLSLIAKNMSYDWVQVDEYMQALGLPTDMLTQSAATISGGEAARMALIRSLLLQPEILLLDEPTAYLDEGSRKRLLQVLSSWLRDDSQRAMIIVSHQMEDFLELPGITCLDLSGNGVQGGR